MRRAIYANDISAGERKDSLALNAFWIRANEPINQGDLLSANRLSCVKTGAVASGLLGGSSGVVSAAERPLNGTAAVILLTLSLSLWPDHLNVSLSFNLASDSRQSGINSHANELLNRRARSDPIRALSCNGNNK